MKVWTVQKKGGKCDKRLNEIVHNKKKKSWKLIMLMWYS